MRTLIFQLFLGGEGKDFAHLGEENQQKQFELQTEEEKSESLRYNRILAEYYLKQVEEEGNHELRTIQALTTHMVQANMIDDLREFLLLPRVFKVMFSSDLRIEFLSLWAKCLSSLDSSAAILLSPSELRSEEQGDDEAAHDVLPAGSASIFAIFDSKTWKIFFSNLGFLSKLN